jgi:rhamnopyranosyl-N-acetylglucosaminyl-diphospho-decaprenol beta-1,3/1,4-galactofuranosyltransferase
MAIDGRSSVAAVVVTFNRKVLLCECLDALLAQNVAVDRIVLINNASSDGTEDYLREKGYLGNELIDYVRMPINGGGAGGFHEGVKRAYEAGFAWLWLMDDDVEPLPDALRKDGPISMTPVAASLRWNLKVANTSTRRQAVSRGC